MSATILAALLLQATKAPEPSKPPLRSDGPPERALSPAHDLFYEDENASRPEARTAIHGFGACVASRSPELASETLRRDFTTRSYRTGLFRLTRVNETCFRQRGRMRSAGLLFAGAMAEELLKKDPQSLNVRLARAALQPAPQAFSASDKVAICVVRSMPGETETLLATEVGGATEAAAAAALAPAISGCSASGGQMKANVAGLRAILATAAFRNVAGAGAGPAQRD